MLQIELLEGLDHKNGMNGPHKGSRKMTYLEQKHLVGSDLNAQLIALSNAKVHIRERLHMMSCRRYMTMTELTCDRVCACTFDPMRIVRVVLCYNNTRKITEPCQRSQTS